MARESNWLADIVMTRGAALNAKLPRVARAINFKTTQHFVYLAFSDAAEARTPMRASFTTS